MLLSGQPSIAASMVPMTSKENPAVIPDGMGPSAAKEVPRRRISAMGARAAALRRQRREGETERDRPPEQALPGITRGCATNVNDPEAEQEAIPGWWYLKERDRRGGLPF